MATQAALVHLSDDELTGLQRVAARRRQSVEQVIAGAVQDYLLKERVRDSDWQREWRDAVDAIRSGVPEEMTPEEIDAEIHAAREEIRAERRARSRKWQLLARGTEAL